MSLMVVSFGFKYGIPQEADLVFDVRCLPNPFYVPELKNLTGLDQAVVDYVMQAPESREFLHRIENFLEYALPLYVKEGKSQLMIAVGCTGGKHRSITFARKIGEFCQKLGYAPSVQHRDASAPCNGASVCPGAGADRRQARLRYRAAGTGDRGDPSPNLIFREVRRLELFSGRKE